MKISNKVKDSLNNEYLATWRQLLNRYNLGKKVGSELVLSSLFSQLYLTRLKRSGEIVEIPT